MRLRSRLGAAAAAFLVLLAACSEDPAPPPPKPEPRREAESPISAPAALPSEEASSTASEGQGAGDLLRRYYALIGAKDYRGAYALREQREGAGFAAFAANYERYSAYHATVGQPSQTAAAGDCLYVEVPVQYYGQTKDGKAFGSAGTITLRRHKANGGWRIHTPGARGTVFIYDDQGERRRAC